MTQVYWRDTEVRGLSLRVSTSGKRDWHWGSGAKRRKLGDFCPEGLRGLNYAMAVTKANPLAFAKAEGKDWHVAIATKPPCRTLAELVDAFLTEKHPPTRPDRRGNQRPNQTHHNIRSMLAPLLRLYPDTPPEQITRDAVKGCYTRFCLPHSPHSARKMASWTRTMRNWAVRNNRVPSMQDFGHMLEDDRNLRVRSRPHKYAFSDAELVNLFDAIDRLTARWEAHPHYRARGAGERENRHAMGYLLVLFLSYTGMRKDEVGSLGQDEISGDWIVLRDHKTVQHVGERKVYLGPEARRVLHHAARLRNLMHYNGKLVFPGPLWRHSQRGEIISNPNEFLRTALAEAGIEAKIVVHSLRSLWINYALRTGMPLDIVRENVGHSDERVTMKHYVAQAEGEMEEGIDRMHERFAALRTRMGWEEHGMVEEVVALNVREAKRELAVNPERRPAFSKTV